MERKQLIIIGIITMLICIGVLSGCVNTESEEDSKFKVSITVCESKIESINKNIVNAVNNQDTGSFQYWCGQLQINTKVAISMIKNISVSDGLLSVKTGYLAYFNDLQTAGYFGENGDVDNYISYYSKAVAHKLEIH